MTRLGHQESWYEVHYSVNISVDIWGESQEEAAVSGYKELAALIHAVENGEGPVWVEVKEPPASEQPGFWVGKQYGAVEIDNGDDD